MSIKMSVLLTKVRLEKPLYAWVSDEVFHKKILRSMLFTFSNYA
jgi:hypothetical protein